MIRGSNFAIRYVRKDDLPTLIPLLNDIDLRGEYLPSTMRSPVEWEREYEANGMVNDNATRLLIVDDKDQILGSIWHFKASPYFNAREIGYAMYARQQRGKGIMTEAVSLVVRNLFETLHINRLEIRMSVGNAASERVAIKCGFQKEGVSRGANFVRGRHVDMNLYALLREELAKLEG